MSSRSQPARRAQKHTSRDHESPEDADSRSSFMQASEHKPSHTQSGSRHSTKNGSDKGNNCGRFLLSISLLALVVLLMIALSALQGNDDKILFTQTFPPGYFNRSNTTETNSTYVFQNDTYVAGAAPSSGTVEDPVCTVTNIEIGFAQCANKINRTFSTDALFYPNASRDLGSCVVPYANSNLRQFIAVRTPFVQQTQYWTLTGTRNASEVIAEYQPMSQLVQYLQTNSSANSAARPEVFTLRTQFVDPNPVFYYRGQPRACDGVFTFTLLFEECPCFASNSSVGFSSILRDQCDCSNATAPLSVSEITVLNTTQSVLNFSLSSFSQSYSSTGSASASASESSTGGASPSEFSTGDASTGDSSPFSTLASEASTQQSISATGSTSADAQSSSSQATAVDTSSDTAAAFDAVTSSSTAGAEA
jgi:hypothetical protein